MHMAFDNGTAQENTTKESAIDFTAALLGEKLSRLRGTGEEPPSARTYICYERMPADEEEARRWLTFTTDPRGPWHCFKIFIGNRQDAEAYLNLDLANDWGEIRAGDPDSVPALTRQLSRVIW
jgi:hypothetical protein